MASSRGISSSSSIVALRSAASRSKRGFSGSIMTSATRVPSAQSAATGDLASSSGLLSLRLSRRRQKSRSGKAAGRVLPAGSRCRHAAAGLDETESLGNGFIMAGLI
jgi:hypothetical protein